MRAHNVMEDIAKKHLDEMLLARSDICTCDTCREDILAYTLTRLPAKYVTTQSGEMHALMQQVRVEKMSVVLKQLVNAIEVVRKAPHHEHKEDKDQAYRLLMEQIKADRGVDFSHYRDGVLRRRIALRMRARDVSSYSDYLQVLIHKPEEYEKLFEVMTINVSSFFRDSHVWNKLKNHVLPDIIRTKKKQLGVKKIKIWSAGCAHGEEPYSLAIILYELLEKENTRIDVQIIATDIDNDSLKQAKSGRYNKQALKGISSYCLKRFFIPISGEKFQIVPHVKEMVQFHSRNLIHDPGINGVDLVVCRNVFIYFNRSLQEHLIMKFYDALVVDGYFVMGNSESLLGEASQVFKGIDINCRIYQKKAVLR